MNDCPFCLIASGEIPCDIIYGDERVVVFADIQPRAPVHLLCAPREHKGSVLEADVSLVGHIFAVIAERHEEWGLAEGFRVVTNCGDNGRQTVGHLHFHVLGGRQLSAGFC
ncbi:MAG: HIT domain-containing protein [Oscillospiraceae bacterium]|jgi:histidine triad (HIT) family protein|nr:HIT domain-containing protein [Oscillospiraceae bacterium]